MSIIYKPAFYKKIAHIIKDAILVVTRDILTVVALVGFFLTPGAALPYTKAYVPNKYTLSNSNCSTRALRILMSLWLLPMTIPVLFLFVFIPPLCIPFGWKYRKVEENYEVGPKTQVRLDSPFFARKYKL